MTVVDACPRPAAGDVADAIQSALASRMVYSIVVSW